MRATLLAALTLLLLCTSCDRKVFYNEDKRTDVSGWNMGDEYYFDVDVTDTLRVYTFYVDLRVSNDYPYSNAFLFINTSFPDHRVAHDTLECPIADVDGRWYGHRTGRYIDYRYILRKDMLFPTTGRYRFSIAHGMRDTSIAGIQNVGLRIEYSDNK